MILENFCMGCVEDYKDIFNFLYFCFNELFCFVVKIERIVGGKKG